jgi:hypothetical protein
MGWSWVKHSDGDGNTILLILRVHRHVGLKLQFPTDHSHQQHAAYIPCRPGFHAGHQKQYVTLEPPPPPAKSPGSICPPITPDPL